MTNPNLKAPNRSHKGLQLRIRDKDLWANIPICFNEWSLNRGKDVADLPKTAIIKFTIHTCNHGVGARTMAKDTSYGSISTPHLDRTKENLKAVIKNWMSICKELLPRMLNVGLAMLVELFQAHLISAATQDFITIVSERAISL